MRTIKILHAADLHLDSPFEALGAGKAVIRRSEQRELLTRLAELARREQVDLVLLAGDLLDSDNMYHETGETLLRCFAQMAVPVFIAPGNHDYYSTSSPYARLNLPENVHLFTSSKIECTELPKLGVRVYGAAFTDKSASGLLKGFQGQDDDMLNILCMHADEDRRDSRYNPVRLDELERSGLNYAAFGHIHKASGLLRAGNTFYSWPGCPEGRGFDELGEKTVNIVTLSPEECSVEQKCISTRKYEIMSIDVTGLEPLLAIHTALPDDTVRDTYRIILTGEAEQSPDLNKLYANLEELFFELQLRDQTRLRRSVWESVGSDTLRGLFLTKLKAQYDSETDDRKRRLIEQAARWGLAALDNAEEVQRHENK